MEKKEVKTRTSATTQKADKKGAPAKPKAEPVKQGGKRGVPKKDPVSKASQKDPVKEAAGREKALSSQPVPPEEELAKKEATKKPTKRGSKNPPRIGSRRKEFTRTYQDKFLEALVNNRYSIYKACKEAGIARKTFYIWRDTDDAFMKKYDDLGEAKVDAWEEALHQNILDGREVSTIFGLKTKGRKRGYGEKAMPSKEAIAIVKRLNADEITTKEAAYQLYLIGEQIPDVMKIELSKTPPDLPPPELPPAMSDEELEERYQKGIATQNQQKDTFVPERRLEVQAMKEELKEIESFGPNAEMRKGDHDQSKE